MLKAPENVERAKGLTYPFGMKWQPEFGQVTEVADGVYMLRMWLPFGLDHINLWLLEDGDGWTIVDTCVDMPDSRKIWEQVFEGPMAGKPIKRVIVTHMHPDHVGLAGWLTRRFGCALWMSRTEFLMCRTLVSDTGKDVPEDAITFYRAAGNDEDALERYRERFGGFGKAVSKMPDSFRRIVDREVFEVNGRYWQVITGSGHSPEHSCLYCPGLKLIISGDQVISRISSNVSVFPTEPEGNPLDDWLRSCARLREILPDNLLVLPSHQQPFYGLHTRLTHLIEGHERALSQLFDHLDEPRRAIDCFGPLFKRTISGDNFQLAIGETLAHLNCLIGRRMVMKERNEKGVDFYSQRPNAGDFETETGLV